jgi:hypothetical protein
MRGRRADRRSLLKLRPVARARRLSARHRGVFAAPDRAFRWPHVVPPPARFSRRLKGQPLHPSLGRAFTAAVSELLAGGHSAPGRSPGAARERGERSPAPAGAAPAVNRFPGSQPAKNLAPDLRRRPFRVAPPSKRLAKTPLKEQGKGTMQPDCGGSMDYIPRSNGRRAPAVGQLKMIVRTCGRPSKVIKITRRRPKGGRYGNSQIHSWRDL